MLYIVGTPIGNLKDITFRAFEILQAADVIVAESIPDTKKLLAALEIAAPKMIKYNDRNKEHSILGILKLTQDQQVVFVTSAGMPSISDPGNDLVAACYKANIQVQPIPGPSALSTAVAMSGFSGKRVIFFGFLPRKKSRIKDLLVRFVETDSIVVFFDSPFRIVKNLEYIQAVVPEIEVFIGREMTKKFETYICGPINEIIKQLQASSYNQKGEFTVVMSQKGGNS